MAKKPAVAKKPTVECTKQLVEAIVTVKSLQDFIAGNGGVDQAIEAAARVQKLIELTGGFDELNLALKIVGGEPAPAAPQA
jgi:hypothetical protein